MFDKDNQKLLVITSISILLSMSIKIIAFYQREDLLINYEVVFLLVLGPAMVVTMIIVLQNLSRK